MTDCSTSGGALTLLTCMMGELLLRDVLLQWLSLMDLECRCLTSIRAVTTLMAQVPQASQGVQLDRYRLYK